MTWANQLSVASSDDTGIAAVPSIHAVNSGNNKQATSKRHRRRVSIRNHLFFVSMIIKNRQSIFFSCLLQVTKEIMGEASCSTSEVVVDEELVDQDPVASCFLC